MPKELKQAQTRQVPVNNVHKSKSGFPLPSDYVKRQKMKMRRLRFQRHLPKQLAYIEKHRFKDFDKAYDELNFQRDSRKYNQYIRDMNDLFSHDMRQRMASDLQQYGPDGKLVDVNAFAYQAGFYIGLLMTNKTARHYMLNLFRDVSWPPNRNKHKFINALQDRDNSGREPFTPHSAALCLTALAEKTHKNVRQHPEKQAQYLEQYRKLREAIYDLAAHDGVDKKDINKQQHNIVREIIKDDPKKRFEFEGLSTGRIEEMGNEFQKRDVFGNLAEETEDLKPQTLLDKDSYQAALGQMVNNSGKGLVQSDENTLREAMKNYYQYQDNLDELAKSQGIRKSELKSWHEDTASVPLDVMHGSLSQDAKKQFGKKAGQVIDVATQFGQRAMLADNTTDDYKRRMYQFCRDNKIDGVKTKDLYNFTSRMQKVMQKSTQVFPLSLEHVYQVFNRNNDYRLNQDNHDKHKIDDKSIDERWMANMLGQKGAINPPVMHDTAWQDMTRYEHLHEKLENATHEMEKANKRLVDDLNKKWAEKASKWAHKGYNKSKTPTKAKVYKLDYDRSSLGRFTKLTEKLQDKYKLQGACLVLDAYQKAKDHNVIDNRGQYLDINDYESQKVFKAVQNIVKNDKHHLLDEAVSNYSNSLYQDPEISDYVANGNLSPEELADKADPDKSFGKEVENEKTKEKETKVMNQNVPKPTGNEKLVTVDKYNPQVKIKPKIAEGPDVPLINRNNNQATKSVEKSGKTELRLPQIDIDKENPQLAKNLKQKEDDKQDQM